MKADNAQNINREMQILILILIISAIITQLKLPRSKVCDLSYLDLLITLFEDVKLSLKIFMHFKICTELITMICECLPNSKGKSIFNIVFIRVIVKCHI